MGITKSIPLAFMSTLIVISLTTATAQSFKCSSGSDLNSVKTCNAIIDYVSPNRTTLSAIGSLFNVSSLLSLLGANNLPISASANRVVNANQTVKIPIPCICNNGTGKSNDKPIYTVVPDDTLYHIAAEVFSGLVTFLDIQAANNISDPNLIRVGQNLSVPLPCSCDDVEGQRVIHYGYVVPFGSSVQGIARQFNISQDVLLSLNNLSTPNDLKAGAVLDVPLPACTSMVRNDSLDYPLLVPNATYVFTAADCVMCKCDAANNWTLQCEPSQVGSTRMPTCPSMQCENMYLGNTSLSGCNRSTCSYAGYSNQTIFTTTSLDSTCPAPPPDNGAAGNSLHGCRWNIIGIAFHFMLLCMHFR